MQAENLCLSAQLFEKGSSNDTVQEIEQSTVKSRIPRFRHKAEFYHAIITHCEKDIAYPYCGRVPLAA